MFDFDAEEDSDPGMSCIKLEVRIGLIQRRLDEGKDVSVVLNEAFRSWLTVLIDYINEKNWGIQKASQ